MNAYEIKHCNSIPMLRDRVRKIQNIVLANPNKPELRLRNEAVKICNRLVELGC